MNKRLTGFLIGTLLLINSLSYSQVEPSRVVVLPDSIVAKIIDELIIKDHLVFELNKKDSIITVYQQKNDNLSIQVGFYKLNEEEYKTIILKEREQSKGKDGTIKILNRKLTWAKIGEIALSALALLELVVIVMLATK